MIRTAVLGLTAATVAALALVPIVYLVYEVLDAGPGEAFGDAFRSDGVGGLLGTSTVYAAASTALALAVGTFQAFVVVRTDAPARRLIALAAVVPLFLPGLLYAIGWVFLASPRTGILNRALEPVFGPEALDVFGLGGMIVVEGLHLAPLVFLLIAGALAAQSPALEEAATVAGASMRQTLRRVTLPLAAPALLAAALLCAVRALEGFEVPAILGVPSGTWVFTSRIYDALSRFPADVPAAGAGALTLLAITAIGAVVAAALARGGRRFEPLPGAGGGARRLPLGRWRRPTALAALAIGVPAALLPVGALLWVSFQPFYAPPSADSLGRVTLENYRGALSGVGLEAIGTSLLLAAGAATLVVGLAAIAAWLIVRARVPGRSALEVLGSAPLAIPGLVVGLSLLVVTTRAGVLYGTVWILIVAFAISALPYGMRTATAAMNDVGGDLEEAAHAAGAGWWASFRRIVLPLVAPGLAAAWLFVLVLSVRELSAIVVIMPAGTELVAFRLWSEYQQGGLAELAALGLVTVAVLLALTVAAWRLGKGRMVG